MATAFLDTPEAWAEMVVTELESTGGVKYAGQERAAALKYWTAIKKADQQFNILKLKVTTVVTIPVTAVAPLPSAGTGDSTG